MSKLLITKDYYINFLIKIYAERNYHEDFSNLNKEKLNILNKYLGLKDKVIFENNKIILKPLNKLNLFKLKNIKGFEVFNDFKNKSDKDNLVSYINIYFNILLEKITNENYKISLGIEYCTNPTNEFVKKLMNQHIKNTVISSHMEQIKREYKEALTILFDTLYFNSKKTNINWEIEINNETDKDKMLFQLDEFDYF